MSKTQTAPTGKLAVLALLKRMGPISADAMARRLELTAMAVRQHLYTLRDEGLADHVEEARPRGRPVKLWRATVAADAQFADSHAALALDLIRQIKDTFGERGMERVLKLRTAEQEKLYRVRTDKASSLEGRLAELAKLRSAEGYMAEIRRAKGEVLFVENHCPICAAARACSGLCQEELALFERVLGRDVKVERVSHILAGAGRCAYRVTALK
ncbi:MAG: transcriptional regulator [Alphaproteobacteria bacterium]|nr:transcriptional regulator [Alphaproteobacteria bacterium]MBV9694397.1 transcriptional regulator [Alphaproteobacteria bacterium]